MPGKKPDGWEEKELNQECTERYKQTLGLKAANIGAKVDTAMYGRELNQIRGRFMDTLITARLGFFGCTYFDFFAECFRSSVRMFNQDRATRAGSRLFGIQ